MREVLSEQVGGQTFAKWDALPADDNLAALLNDNRSVSNSCFPPLILQE
jgi:hypothetical protein